MEYTTNYRLRKPQQDDLVNVDDFNRNSDTIDGALNDIQTEADQIRNKLGEKADLDEDGKIVQSQLPDLSFIPLSEKGQPNGVAELDENGKVKGAEIGGIPAQIIVTSPVNSVITVSKGTESYTKTNVTGELTFELQSYGEWTVAFEQETQKVVIDTVKQYKVFFNIQSYRTMTVKINQANSNPATCMTYADDAVSMTAGSDAWDDFFGHYPCLVKNGLEVGKLQKNNFDKFENGSTADISSGNAGDCMIAFPRRGLKISTSGDVVTISMTDEPNNPNFTYFAHTKGSTQKDVFYVGAYLGYEASGKLRSLKGKTPTPNKTIGAFRTLAKANGSGYEQMAFYQLTFLQAMYCLKYKNLDSQTAVGQGVVSSSGAIATGGTESYGMDGKSMPSSYKTDGKHHMKLFGIEDFYGNLLYWIDGIYSDANRNILTATQNFNDTGSGYRNCGSSGLTSNTYGYMNKIQGDSDKGFVLKAANGSSSTYFCDSAYLYASYLAFFGGSWSFGAGAGAFRLSVHYSASNATSSLGARLIYI